MLSAAAAAVLLPTSAVCTPPSGGALPEGWAREGAADREGLLLVEVFAVLLSLVFSVLLSLVLSSKSSPYVTLASRLSPRPGELSAANSSE